MTEPKRPNSLVFNDAMLKGFMNGTLEPAVEEKIASLLEARPELLEKISAKSGDGFLKRLREVQQRSFEKSPTQIKAEVIEPAPVNKAATKVDSSIPTALASYAGYKISKELGRGGMGVVYLAKNIQMDRLEVLKVLNERLLNHEGAKERFLREIRAVSKLSHTNIVTSYSILPLDNLLVFAMEYVHGIDLQQYTHKFRPLSVGLACSFAKQIAAGLEHAHEKRLVHRDIKPSNIIVYKSGGQLQLKILDFGLAKATIEESAKGADLTQDGTMLGTPEYMSPEQTLNAAKADIRADIYSLGCTLYYMLTGKPPFTGTHGAVLVAHAQREPTATNLVRPDVPAELAAVVGKMLAKDVRKRYQTPSEVASALSPFVSQSRSAANQSAGAEAVSNTVNDLSGPDRETSVEAPLSELSLDTNNQAAEPQQDLAALAGSLKAKRAAPQSQPSVLRTKAKPRFPMWFIPTVATLGAMIFFFTVWQLASFTFKTPNGTIVVENMPADAEVLVDGQKFEIVWNAGKDRAEVRIDAGSHQLQVLNQGNEIFADKVSVKGGDSTVLKLSVVKNMSSSAQNAPDPFKVGSIWRDPKNTNHLTILSRNGENFSASFIVGAGTERIVRGTVADGNVAWFGKDVRPVRGGQGADNFGTLVKNDQGYHIDFTWGNGGITTPKEGGKFVLRLDATDDVNPQVPSQSDSAKAPNQNWFSLFNGRDLTGWKQHPESTGKWTVEQGEIVGRGSDQSHLFTERDDYTDFHIRAEAKINATGNSGICFRTKFFGQGRLYGNGYEANIEGDKFAAWQTGSIMHIDPKGQVVAQRVPPDKWFTLEVIAKDNMLTTKVDGTITARIEDSKRLHSRGHIALQQLGEATEVRFRKVEIQGDVAPVPQAAAKATVYTTQSSTTGMELVLLQPGTFTMGSPNQEIGRQADEVPHQVSITKPFYLGKYEVTQAEFKQVSGFNPSKFNYSNLLPVENVSWYDAIYFCNKLSERDGLQAAYDIANEKKEGDSIISADITWNRAANGYRLPTEAEWEYACRAGTSSPFSFGDNIAPSQVNYDGDYPYNGGSKSLDRASTAEVKLFTPNAFGVYQMHGNVCEWCWDLYAEYELGPQSDPVGMATNATRVFRGGGWFNYAVNCRTADRDESLPASRNFHRGFRIARNVVEPAGTTAITSREATILFGKPEWRTIDDELIYEGKGGNNWILFGKQNWGDYSFELELMNDRTNVPVSMLFRSPDDSRLVHCGVSWPGFRNGRFYLEYRDAKSDYNELRPSIAMNALPENTWHKVRVRVEGKRGEFFVNDVQVLTCDNLPFEKGRIGLRTFKPSKTRFRNLKVLDLSGKELWTGPPTFK